LFIAAHHVLKTRKVSETPVHKQGRNSVLHKMERLRRYSNIQSEGVEVVEESPMKPFPDRNSKYVLLVLTLETVW